MSIFCLEPREQSDLDNYRSPSYHARDGQPIMREHLDNGQDQGQWFTHAQEVDPKLGTLSYLPFEIRQLIFAHVLSCHPTFSADGFWEYGHRLGTPLNVTAYYFDGCYRSTIDPRAGGLRQTSSSIKAEFEDVLLSKRTFRFNDPESLMAFITRLDKSQLDRVFSISIGICMLYQVENWLKPVGQLPPNLTEVQFKVYTAFNEYTQPGSLNIFKDIIYEAALRVPNARISICGSGREPLTQDCLKIATDFVQSRSQKPRSC